ncbi:exodeoxyribonuclease V subunit gamma [Tessaracoccus sp. HDW20]|uniref:exodeoxyribonuclease V subunit gamma n=1 Tax=Tessaracoccus coleopterorum TaxID=2714950 RepID=UPI0018D43532|nr:exodeoxyribonuclease V subunit gamma [Tessaracoccus coleopterorum]NHB85917.1 exodeoxyribonuclease V subunit gamma [Tessaracoccus coleopterorum]
MHDSHGPGRQIEVLRDELTRAFADDPTLEPRDVAIICPHPQRYAALLDGAFKQAVDGGHPGRSLRVQPVAGQAGNPVVSLMATVLRLGELRASASQLVELLLSAPLAHRWRLSDRQAVIELVGGAGIRWGMDAGHRAEFDLEGLAQNTWLRGLDRLLIGLTLADGHDGGLSLAGSDVVGSSDLETVGALCEIVSRLRRLIAATQQSATIPAWVRRARAVISDLIGLPAMTSGRCSTPTRCWPASRPTTRAAPPSSPGASSRTCSRRRAAHPGRGSPRETARCWWHRSANWATWGSA